MRRHRHVRLALLGTVAAGLVVIASACTSSAGGPVGSGTGGPGTSTRIVGTSTVTSTLFTTDTTFTAPPPSTPGAPGSTRMTGATPSTGSGAPTGGSTLPAAVIGECPYLAASDVMAINGQHAGATSIIPIKPYPICIFTRSDGGYLASTRIVVAATPAGAMAAVNAAAPVDESFPVNDPAGWSGGAMSLPNGTSDNPLSRSVYAVSHGKTAIIAESNQAQSIKGRQMVEQIVANQGW
jgi:hypothetical protein